MANVCVEVLVEGGSIISAFTVYFGMLAQPGGRLADGPLIGGTESEVIQDQAGQGYCSFPRFFLYVSVNVSEPGGQPYVLDI